MTSPLKAVCLRDCTWKGRYWTRGSIYHGFGTPPTHFRVIEPMETEIPEADEPEAVDVYEKEGSQEMETKPRKGGRKQEVAVVREG